MCVLLGCWVVVVLFVCCCFFGVVLFYYYFFFGGGGGVWVVQVWELMYLNNQRVDIILLSTLNYLFYIQQCYSRDLFIKSCSGATEQNAFNNWISRSIRFTLPLDTGFLSTDIM